MKPVMLILAIVAAGLCVCGAAVTLGDRQTFVAPPDSAAEGFVRALIERRYDIARGSLSSTLRRSTNAKMLRDTFEPVRRQIGDAVAIEAVVEWIEGDQASARTTIEAQLGTLVLQVRLVREQGVWVVGGLPQP